MVDALSSGGSECMLVGVQLPPLARKRKPEPSGSGFFVFLHFQCTASDLITTPDSPLSPTKPRLRQPPIAIPHHKRPIHQKRMTPQSNPHHTCPIREKKTTIRFKTHHGCPSRQKRTSVIRNSHCGCPIREKRTSGRLCPDKCAHTRCDMRTRGAYIRKRGPLQ